ncbi:hypothetical protein FRC0129_00298 [Corynebacterium diphtheriae]|nr:hypothetical protein CIP107549_00266 [Corynebacterium diphtheriae]CAB0734278.1 hypothetical protein FRC0129_00298 [Corynebacterium diphtheriae]CAB0935267.1 hypothetical protein FRC0478_00094 [Corynebacterium diphtheriae]CAB0938084.1 hypothetical protein FRC0475_00277 [Corynebacterium diphtheriae]CAB0995583.1 hypothetical protein FRC0515_00232 [Corynebacterium diphtheriae]
MKACWVVDDGQIDQAADDAVAQYSRLPACGAFIDGLGFDGDGISVGLHSRSLVVDGWFRCPFSYKAKDPNILCHARTPGELISAF